MSADTGGAAFPVPEVVGCLGVPQPASSFGMSLLDYFAGQALTEMLRLHCDGARDWGTAQSRAVSDAYDIAAAMLTERARRTEGK